MARDDNRQLDVNEQSATQSGGPGPQLAKLAVFVMITGGLLYSVLSLVQPQYRSVAQLYVERAEPGKKTGREGEKLVSTAMAALRSSALINSIIAKNNLAEDREFNTQLVRKGPMKRVAIMLGISANPAKTPKDQRVREAFMDKLAISKGRERQTIQLAVRSNGPEKSAHLANDLAAHYINSLAVRPRDQKPSQAVRRKSAFIDRLRDRIGVGETRLARLRADLRNNPPVVETPPSINIAPPGGADAAPDETETGAGEVRLEKEQLSKLVTRHILARADREEAELRATLVKDMLASTGELHGTSTVLNSGLVQRLLIRRSRMERQMADLEVTLLPSHPQLKRLIREMSALKAQIRREAEKAVVQLEDEAKIAAAKEKSLKDSLDELQNTPASIDFASVAPVNVSTQARPTPADVPVIIDARVTRLARIEEMLADNRQDMAAARAVHQQAINASGAQKAPLIKATIIATAVAVSAPVFPKKKPITALGMLAAFCLGLIAMLFGNRSQPKLRDETDVSAFDKPANAGQDTPVPVGFGARPIKA